MKARKTSDLYQVTTGVAPVFKDTHVDSERVTEALFGETVQVVGVSGEWAEVFTKIDSYHGYIALENLYQGPMEPTHRVSALRTVVHRSSDVESPRSMVLAMNSLVTVAAEQGKFVYIENAGWVSKASLSPVGEFHKDYVDLASRMIDTPYDWGCRSTEVDCSGFVHTILTACGHKNVPRDSGEQAKFLGEELTKDHPRRGDLVFWSGHVGVMYDTLSIIHATQNVMRVTRERLNVVEERLLRESEKSIVAVRRLSR